MTADDEIRKLERDALGGDIDAVRSLGRLARRECGDFIIVKDKDIRTVAKPRVVRNFWVIIRDDEGREKAAGSSRSGDDGIEVDVIMRSENQAKRVLRIQGFADEHGKLKLNINDVTVIETER